MRQFPSEYVDLICLNLPFNSNKTYEAPIGSKAAGAAFKDAWPLDDVKEEEHGLIADINPALHELIKTAQLTHDDSMMAFMI